jgi:hypothetical protein
VGGFSYALIDMINAISKKANAKKSYFVISISPLSGAGLTAYRTSVAPRILYRLPASFGKGPFLYI